MHVYFLHEIAQRTRRAKWFLASDVWIACGVEFGLIVWCVFQRGAELRLANSLQPLLGLGFPSLFCDLGHS